MRYFHFSEFINPSDTLPDFDVIENLANLCKAVLDPVRHQWGRPIAVNSERSWKALMDVMCSLVNAGVDPVLLRRMSYVTPACGLANHSDAVAEQVFAQVRNIATKVGEQATASRLTLGS
jgi:hypothetical protein